MVYDVFFYNKERSEKHYLETFESLEGAKVYASLFDAETVIIERRDGKR